MNEKKVIPGKKVRHYPPDWRKAHLKNKKHKKIISEKSRKRNRAN